MPFDTGGGVTAGTGGWTGGGRVVVVGGDGGEVDGVVDGIGVGNAGVAGVAGVAEPLEPSGIT